MRSWWWMGLLALASMPGAWADGGPRKIDALVADWLEDNNVESVAVGVIRGGRLVLAAGYGYADREKDLRATPDTDYMLASVSKPFVALAALKLVEQGKLDLDADISRYLGFKLRHPWFPQKKITLRQLLTHRAGIKDASDEEVEDYPALDPDQSLEDTVRAALLPSGPEYRRGAYWLKKSPPGRRFEYANLGAALAALVIEKAADLPFNEYCNQEFFEPLGMKRTRWFYRELPKGTPVAMPCDEDGEPYGLYSFNDYPSGSLRSSVHDLARFLQMLLGRGERDGAQVLTPASIREFETRQAAAEDGEWIGLNIYSQDGKEFSHDGGEAGVSTEIRYCPARGDAIILLSNTDDADFDELLEVLWDGKDDGDDGFDEEVEEDDDGDD